MLGPPMLRILHTSDWHLGHTLSEVPRVEEHASFLEWLLDTLEREEIDALLVAGDVFDTANPPAEAQQAFYRFLARARARCPSLDVIVIGGNHDSAARLDAPNPILEELGIRVVGGAPRRHAEIDWDKMIVPITDRRGDVAAWVAAVPFLRPADLPTVSADDPLIAGVEAFYASMLDRVRARRSPGQAIVAMGHCYMTGTRLSELSERKVLGGNQHALPATIFPDDVAYVALGHLHLAQTVGGRAQVRYSGSPLPLSFGEIDYRHEVVVVELEGERVASQRSLPVPRTVPMIRIPAREAATLDEVVAALATLPGPQPDGPAWQRPYLEVAVLLPRPEPDLRATIERALEGKAARLLRLTLRLTGTGRNLADEEPVAALEALRPEDVFRLCHAQRFATDPDPTLLAAFSELVEDAEAKT